MVMIGMEYEDILQPMLLNTDSTHVVIVICGVTWDARSVLHFTSICARPTWPFSDAKCSTVHLSFF